jgi:hypothetical protein
MRFACVMNWKEYQTLIVGALGFTGVILTLLANAWLNRKQHTRQVEHERTALKAALSAELSIIRDSYVDRINMIGDGATQSMLVPLDTMTGVYEKAIEKIGLLSRDQVDRVLRAYLLVHQMPDRLRFFQDYQTESERNGYLRIAGKHVGHVREMHENFLIDINRAIAALA